MTESDLPALLQHPADTPELPDALALLKPEAAARVAAIAKRAERIAAHASGAGTQRAYASAWKHYAAWCAGLGLPPLNGNAGVLALYLADRAGDVDADPQSGLAVSSLGVARAAVLAEHRRHGVALDMHDARLQAILQGVARAKGTAPRRQAAPAVPDILRLLLDAVASPAAAPVAATVRAARDRALLLLGFGGGLRRAELTALTIGDVAIVPGFGVQLLIRRAKGDQVGKGRKLGLYANPAEPEFCPQAALEAWFVFRRGAPDWTPPDDASAEERRGWTAARPLFCGVGRSGRLKPVALDSQAVARQLKAAAARAGLDAAAFSGHSLRRGILTDAARRREYVPALMRHSRHAKVETLLGYMEAADIWQDNPTEGVFRPKVKG